MERGLIGAVGIGIALFSDLFAVMFIVKVVTGGDSKSPMSTYVGLSVFFSLAFVVGSYMAWSIFGKPPVTGAARPGAGRPQPGGASQTAPEQRVLLYAEQEHGRVTVDEVSAHCDLSVTEARCVLDGFVEQEAAVRRHTAGGVPIYIFAGFISDREKASAEDF
jgi:hypothetical protein